MKRSVSRQLKKVEDAIQYELAVIVVECLFAIVKAKS